MPRRERHDMSMPDLKLAAASPRGVLAAPARRSAAATPKPKPEPRRNRKIPRALNESLAGHDDRVLTFLEWCSFNSFSKQTGRRVLNGEQGEPPEVTLLSAKRIGITIRANREWQARRARGA
jgi:hypothetical protein